MNANQAFGHYLRLLRERRGLSLEQVESLSSGFPEPIRKSYLSRCENGHQAIAFSRIVALSRIYEVPTEVLAQRLELDLEVDRIGVEVDEEESFSELCRRTFALRSSGRLWDYYAGVRRICARASSESVARPFRDGHSQVFLSQVYVASAAMQLGKLEFAEHELRVLAEESTASDRARAILADRLGVLALRKGRSEEAVNHCSRAIEIAGNSGSHDLLPVMHLNLGEVLSFAGRSVSAREEVQKALALEQRQGELSSALNCHVALARIYLEEGNTRAAQRVLEAALRSANGRESGRPAVRINMLLGEIAERLGDLEQAERRWRVALGLARELRDPFLRFETDLFLLKLANRRADDRSARVIAKRMTRLLTKLPATWEDVVEFKRIRAQPAVR